ncbi:MAG TPA: YbaB/EbfC family nucleoid-associated protein [bacterium]|nr:YbaB/EbfC family nucleoid-associated protein [Candidatus Omnitrophota bacterium]HOJ60687.1 YbaB/EbfC family nucleoid-associated protein [bacterium]HOL93519.1 YbaB/EbfC family nucleoid-associated protein [bacterium]HPP00026.1 YbaB/EbfC family nucleoid-associated protein [bacterium]HXK93392.1 YbaB/EbfC family nucleoid-associated protein [bacterium]
MKGLGNLGNIANMVKQAQQIHKKLADIQEELEQVEVTGSSGGGMVTVTMNGKQKIRSIRIDPAVVKADDVAMLEDLVLVAVNEAQDRAQEIAKERMYALTGGISLPGITP